MTMTLSTEFSNMAENNMSFDEYVMRLRTAGLPETEEQSGQQMISNAWMVVN